VKLICVTFFRVLAALASSMKYSKEVRPTTTAAAAGWWWCSYY
jgi:hypothetical protein